MSIKNNNSNILEDEKSFKDIENTDDIDSLCKKIIEKMDKTMSDINSIVQSIFSNIEKSLDRKLTFDEFLQIISTTLDKRILNTQNEDKIKFIGGKLILTVNKLRKVLEYKADCYYQDAFKNWTKQEHKGYIKFSNFDKSAEPQLKEILAKGKMELEIEPPNSDEIEL